MRWLIFAIALILYVVCMEMYLPLALTFVASATMIACAAVALTCPRDCKDDSIFVHHVI